MLRAEGVHAGYGHGSVLVDVTIDVRAGSFVVLLGANGAGKTTTLRVLSGLVSPSGGRIRLDDEDVTGAGPERLAAGGVAHIPEGRGTFRRLTVRENLLMGLYPRRRTRPDRSAELGRVYELFPLLRERSDQRAGSLSGGEQQMLAVARALVSRPRVLLVDEPSHGLAPGVVASLFATFDRLRADGLGLLVVEQQASRALALADVAHVLDRGRITYTGDPEALLADRQRLTEAYLGVSR